MRTRVDVSQMQIGSLVAVPRIRAIVALSKIGVHVTGLESGKPARLVGLSSKPTSIMEPVASIFAKSI